MKKIAFLGSIIVLLSLMVWGYFYFNSEPSDIAENAANSTKSVDVLEENNILVFTPRKTDAGMSVILYPGAFIDALSYAPLAKELASTGYKTYIVGMPLNLAVFGKNRAADIIDESPDEKFVIGGHSLGGVMSARFAHDNEEEIQGVFFLASYPDEKGSLKNASFPAISITATNDEVLNKDSYNENKKYLPKDTTFVSIEGGNHAQFGSYGTQHGDGRAEISGEEQTDQVANAMIAWLKTSVQNQEK
ncbi:alpha/beta hydrolase [Listeria ivanovii]|uniref:Alpha/beta hydrolase fold-5 domain-containing protein n=1 Tax=Listeria ivanovii (strain ATCC BAA-678 / PAM 55) TaxID=881621 RepID=G2Z952_LISIP|nr:alpha/beta hydrolase [Listeria ivanovii]AHI56007.1 alpha/beta hydrolase [Listeria ivanovii WSLC3009]AIS65446.1 carboxymethylenebutenolidase [Listeria ivanovii subsp. ivanovii]MBC1759358.1 alpha/beta hydrolase [Listeria ivanovii]MCJ1717423.1 alpha/beta hydrolase [Listeria ivanovii]MCJ1722814.1 alpha/beta hydrolase [Listeria ivanovii]